MSLHPRARAALAAALLGACGGPAPAVARPPAATPVDDVGALLDAARVIAAAQLDAAGPLLARARRAAGADFDLAGKVAYLDATLATYRGDLEAAAAVLVARLPAVSARPDTAEEFYLHNHLIMLRMAQGDLAGAVLECDAMTAAGERGQFAVEGRTREVQVRLKDAWHRAYLLRAHAATRTGSAAAAALAYAERARADYRALATEVGGFADSIAVLDAFFAVHAGDRPAALAAARRVGAGNDDVEDLYFTAMGLDFGGDAAAAAAVVERMRRVGYVSHANPVYLGFVERDRAGDRFTPRHPGAPAR